MMMVVRHCQNYIQAIATIIAYSLGCTNTVKGLFCQALQHPLPRMTLSRAASSNHRAHERQNLKNEFKMTAQFITNKMCPFAQKAWIALEYSKIPYSIKEINLYGAGGKPKWFLTYNPSGTVPVLVVQGDGDKDSTNNEMVFTDSEDILTALSNGTILQQCDVGGSTKNEKNRLLLVKHDNEGGNNKNGDNRNFQSTMKEQKQLVEKWRTMTRKELLPIGKKAVQSSNDANLNRLFLLLQEMDSNVIGPYLCGSNVTIADCAAFPFLWRINNEFGPLIERKGCKRLGQWLIQCEELVEFKKSIQSAWWWWW